MSILGCFCCFDAAKVRRENVEDIQQQQQQQTSNNNNSSINS
jgi:hypothetical protein